MQERKHFLGEVVYRSIILVFLFFFSRSIILNSGWPILKLIFPVRESLFTSFRFLFLAVTFLIVGEYFILERVPENYLLSRIFGLAVMIFLTLIIYGSYYLCFHDHSFVLMIISIIIAITCGQFISYQLQRRSRMRFGYHMAFLNYFLLALLLIILTVLRPQGFIFR